MFITIAFKSYSQQGAIYNSPFSGTLANIPFTLSNLNSPSVVNYNLSSPGFSSAPLSNSQPCLDYAYNSNWSITFDTPIENLRLYCKYWRDMTVSFNHPFTILSGTNVQSPSGNILNTTSYSDAIIEFSNPVTTLTLTILSGGGSSYQAMTFGTGPALSTSDSYKINTLKLHPNPSSDFFQVSGLTKTENYRIFNLLGAEMDNGTLFENKKINTQNLTSGIYFLKIENGGTLKFIKE